MYRLLEERDAGEGGRIVSCDLIVVGFFLVMESRKEFEGRSADERSSSGGSRVTGSSFLRGSSCSSPGQVYYCFISPPLDAPDGAKISNGDEISMRLSRNLGGGAMDPSLNLVQFLDPGALLCSPPVLSSKFSECA